MENFMKYKKRLRKMSQKKRIEELTKENIRKTEITENVYLHGKFVVRADFYVFLRII